RSCTYRVFDLEKIPCPHAMVALRAQYGPKYGSKVYDHSSQYYSVEKYEITYSGHITPVSLEESWVVPAELLGRLIPPSYIDPNTIKGKKAI
ncbi:PMZ-type zinc finger domain-containing protein, partial [Lactobacillus delbrueckii]|uniref:SWIM zinc finger family protein n=1 Tax=Lactobacillus delbrueckii TaxID=1584 RepID=UPI0022EBF04E